VRIRFSLWSGVSLAIASVVVTVTARASTDATPPTAVKRGTVTVNGATFTGGTIAYKSVVDVTHGWVRLTTASGSLEATGTLGNTAKNKVPAAFQLLQTTVSGTPTTELKLVQGDFSVCPKRSTAGETAAPKIVRRLWGTGKGNFQTSGRFAAATVRGTRWVTIDRCDGTLIKVRSGAVQVTNLVTHRVVTVTAGHTYLAKG
jgi:hypothetical protein